MALFKKQEKSTALGPKELARRVKELEVRLEQTTKEFELLKRHMRHAITKVGVTRFNPFKEIGGDQSFSVALLDERDGGVVITSYYGRELNRVYAKTVKGGVSEHELSEEEREAIAQAIGKENTHGYPKHRK